MPNTNFCLLFTATKLDLCLIFVTLVSRMPESKTFIFLHTISLLGIYYRCSWGGCIVQSVLSRAGFDRFPVLVVTVCLIGSQESSGKHCWCCTSTHIWTLVIHWWSNGPVERTEDWGQWTSGRGLPCDIWRQCGRQGHFSFGYLQRWNNGYILLLEGIVWLKFLKWMLVLKVLVLILSHCKIVLRLSY